MNILHLDFDDLENPNGGGQAVRTFEINRRLVKMGHQITVITLNYKNAENKVKEGIKYERSGSIKYPFNFISYLLNIRSVLKKHDFDLVIEDNVAPITFGLTPLYTKKPVISLSQCFFAKESSKKNHLPFWIVEKYAARLYKDFIVLTKTMREKVLKLNKNANIKIIPNGLNEIPPFNPDPGKYLLFVGRIDFLHKGIDYLLQIMEILKTKAPNLTLKIAGVGDDERLRRIINEKELTNVEYLGKIAGDSKIKTFRECSMLIQASRFEIFPFTILEAASYGKPCITFDIENLHEIVNENKIGATVPEFNTELFTEKIIELTENKNLYKTCSQNAYNWAKALLWDNIAKEQESFYLSVVNARKR